MAIPNTRVKALLIRPNCASVTPLAAKSALISALVLGLLVGAMGMCLAYFYPIDAELISSSSFISSIRTFFETYQQYLLLPIAACAIGLGLTFARVK